MKEEPIHSTSIETIETVMMKKLRDEPFHNFYPMLNIEPANLEFGGTCSDKSISLLKAFLELGIDASLHTAFMGGKEVHRLVRIVLYDETYFADVGSGWPSAKLFPKNKEVIYQYFGIQFRTVLNEDHLSVYLSRGGTESHHMDIFHNCRTKQEIDQQIRSRFDPEFQYPFSGKVRFSQIVKDRFLFLRDDKIEIYQQGSERIVISGIHQDQLRSSILTYFGFDIDTFTTDPKCTPT